MFTEEMITEAEIQLKADCRTCVNSLTVTVKAVDLRRYKRKVFIQDAFPYLSVGQREMLISNTCPTCWDRLFGEEE